VLWFSATSNEPLCLKLCDRYCFLFTADNYQNAGEAKKDDAAFEKDLSHATAKVGPFSASSSGAVTKDDPNRQEGAWNQTVGAAKESVGGLVGSEVCLPLVP